MRLLPFILLIVLTSCSENETLHFYSLDKSQCITVIDQDGFKYVINGKKSSIPSTNFVKLDLSRIDPVGLCFHVCWNTQKYDWEAIIDQARVIESRLDSSKFSFKNSLPKDNRGIPTEAKFRKDGCAVFSFDMMKLSPNKGAVVEIK